MTPLAVEMLIWFCTRAPEAGAFPNLKTHEPQKEIRNKMLNDGIIFCPYPLGTEPIYKATEKGQAWLKMLCETPQPIPEQHWVDPRFAE